jgi:hypothetical protein
MDDRWQWLDQKARLREAADNLRSEGWEREADEVLLAADEITRLRRIPAHYGAPAVDPDAAIRWITGIMDTESLHLREENARLTAEVASLRLTLGGKTFSATVPEPIGCPLPGMCSTVAEIGRLRAVIRVNGLRAGASHEEIDEVVYGKR